MSEFVQGLILLSGVSVSQALNKLWHILDHTYDWITLYWCHLDLENAIGHLWVSKSAGLAIKIAFPCKLCMGNLVIRLSQWDPSSEDLPFRPRNLTHLLSFYIVYIDDTYDLGMLKSGFDLPSHHVPLQKMAISLKMSSIQQFEGGFVVLGH